jgi:ankyrin repeat protein/beta-lactamase regulating signal transducer with metallopeptidase domain
MISMGITSAALERLAGSLLHFIWQGAAIAIVTAVALRLLRQRSAECRYEAALGALGAMLVAPFVTFTFYAETGALTSQLLHSLNGAAKIVASEATAGDIAVWTQRIVAVWMIGVIVFLTSLVGGWLLSRRLLRSAAAVVTPVMKEALERARAGLNFQGKVRLLSGGRIETPIVIGWLRPAILLPASALTGLSADQLLSILAHELAHIRRHDFLVNGIQRAVECVLFYHPAVWWVSGRIRVERERCCDDLAVSVCGDRLLYAQALVALEKARSAEPLLALPTAGVGVKDRVRRILGVSSANRDWQSAAAALVFAVILVGAGMFQPTLARPAVQPVASVLPPVPEPPRAPQAQAPAPAAAAPLSAILAIATAEGAQTPGRAGQPASTPQVTQPPIAASREAARDRLGMLRVEYSADSFVKQAAEGDTIAIKTFLAAGMNINARSEKNYTALMKAAEMGHTETVQALLAAGANPNLANTENYSALMLAAWKGDVPTMKVLIAGGADVDLKLGPNEETALIAAASYGQREAVSLLLDNRASIDAKSTARGTALIAAACAGRVDTARTLADRGADVNTRSAQLQTALGCAAQQRNVEFIQFLLDKGADVNLTTYRSYSPLHHALDTGREMDRDKATASAQLLIRRGANVNALADNGITPLDQAVQNRLLEGVRALLDKGANPNKGGSGLPLTWALSGNRPPSPEIALLLIDRGADVNGVQRAGDEAPLLLAVRAREVAVIRALLAKGADPNVSARNNLTPLRAAADSPEIMQLLINAGAKSEPPSPAREERPVR